MAAVALAGGALLVFLLLRSRVGDGPIGSGRQEAAGPLDGPAADVADGVSRDPAGGPPVAEPGAAKPSEGEQAPRTIATGLVLLPDGGPAAGVVVQATRADHAATPFARTVADERGVFRLVSSGNLDVPAQGTDASVRAETSDRRLTSLAERAFVRNGEPARSVVLLLRASATLRGRLVDETGAAVPAGEVLVLSWPVVSNPWENGASDGDRIVATSAADGRFEIGTSPGQARAFFRRPAGVYSRSRRLSLATGESVDLGDVRVGGAAESLVVLVRDASGRPLENAAIRMDPDDGIQRFVAGSGDAWVHVRTDARGEAALRFESLETPLRFAVGHDDYQTVEVVARRGQPPGGRVEVALEEKPRILVRVRGPAGEPMPRTLSPEIRVQPASPGAKPPARRISIDGAADIPYPQDGEVSTSTSLTWATEWRSARAVGDEGDFEQRVSVPGRYRVVVVAGPGVESAADVELTPEAPAATFDCRLPGGRVVRLESSFPESSAAEGADWRVWGGTPAQFPDAWPSTRTEFEASRATGTAMGPPRERGIAEVRHLWIPWDWTVLVARDLEVLTAGPPGPGTGSHGAGEQLRPRPPLLRRPVPQGDRPVVRFELPDENAGAPGGELVIRLSAGGARVPLEGWTLDVRSADAGVARTPRTDASGEARLRVPAGTYVVDVTRDRAPAGPRTVRVSGEQDAAAVVTLDLAGRSWGTPPR